MRMNKFVNVFLTVLALGVAIFVWNYIQLVHDMHDIDYLSETLR